MIKNLKAHPYANARVKIYNHTDYGQDTIILQSYDTDVIFVVPQSDCSYSIVCTGLYSNTTRRHISSFCREYFGFIDYYDIKTMVTNHSSILVDKENAMLYMIDEQTGEVIGEREINAIGWKWLT